MKSPRGISLSPEGAGNSLSPEGAGNGPSSSSSNTTTPITTTSGASKICVVCGDKSYGLNFNAITCESCKAFFRRNALSNKELVCPFSNSCNVTRVTRRFCQRCRLLKCFSVGMKKEHIMSEADKMKKREKIESNRAKKKGSGGAASSSSAADEEPPIKVKKEQVEADDQTFLVLEGASINPDEESQEPSPPPPMQTDESPSTKDTATPSLIDTFVWPSLQSTPTEMVNCIIESPVGSGRVIGHLMQTPEEAILVMEKILNSPKDAIQMISHFINSPGDALKIISKIMNSPFDALTIFTKFMSSPTDALEVITKVIQSPNDVLQFLQQLMRSPEDGLEIMNKFMSSPAEALRMINNMMNQTTTVDSTTDDGSTGGVRTLIEIQPSDSIMNNSAQLKVILDKMGEHLGGSPTSTTMAASSTVDAELESAVAVENIKIVDETTVVGESQEQQQQQQPMEMESILMAQETTTTPQMPAIMSLFGGTTGGGGGPTTTKDIIDMLINQSVNAMDSVVLSEAIKLEYECAMPQPSGMPNSSPSMYSMSSPPPPGGDVRALNDVEQSKLTELILAHQALYAPVDEDISSLIADDYRLKSDQQGADPQLLTLINLTAVAIRRLIKMSKKISAFKNMCQEDQVALLKGGCTEMMMLRSVMQYDSEASSWKIPHKEETTSLRADILKLARGPVYEEHERFILTFEPKWRQDENIILIMCAIILFTPDRPKTIHSDVIKLEQNSYYYLLRRYLESVYPGCEAKSTFMRLIKKVHELRKFNEAVISVYLDVNPAEVEPLLREIFDLKNQ